MKKYKLKIKEQEFTFEDEIDFQNKVKNLMCHGIMSFETESIEVDTEEELKNSVQTIKPIIFPINSKKGTEQRDKIRDKLAKQADEEDKLPKTELPAQNSGAKEGFVPPKRKRRTKAEMIAGEQKTEERVLKPRTPLFPEDKVITSACKPSNFFLLFSIFIF